MPGFLEVLSICLMVSGCGYIIYRLIRYKGFRGAVFGGELVRTFGQVESVDGMVFKVHQLDTPDGPRIGLECVFKSFMNYDMTPFKLDKYQAEQVVALLREAIENTS